MLDLDLSVVHETLPDTSHRPHIVRADRVRSGQDLLVLQSALTGHEGPLIAIPMFESRVSVVGVLRIGPVAHGPHIVGGDRSHGVQRDGHRHGRRLGLRRYRGCDGNRRKGGQDYYGKITVEKSKIILLPPFSYFSCYSG